MTKGEEIARGLAEHNDGDYYAEGSVSEDECAAAIDSAIEAAVAEATGPLLLKIDGLEKGTDDLFKMKNKLLENNAALLQAAIKAEDGKDAAVAENSAMFRRAIDKLIANTNKTAREAVAEEREACAAVAEDKFFFGSGKGAEAFKMAGEALIRRIASEIRARGASKTSIDVLKPPRPDETERPLVPMVSEEFIAAQPRLSSHIMDGERLIASFLVPEDAEAFRNYKRFAREYPQVMGEMERPRPDDIDHVAEEFDVTDHTAAAEIEAIRAWDKAAPAMTRDESLRFRAILEDAEAEIPDHLK